MELQKKKEINHILNGIALYQGLRFSHYALVSSLFVIFIILNLSDNRTTVPLYICFVLLVCPFPFESIVENTKKYINSDKGTPLRSIQEKYGFTTVKKKTQLLTAIFTSLLFLAWKIRYILHPVDNHILMILPQSILLIWFILFILIFLIYFIKFHFFYMSILFPES